MTKDEFRYAHRQARLILRFEEETGFSLNSLMLKVPLPAFSACMRYGDRLQFPHYPNRPGPRHRRSFSGPRGVLPA